MLAFASAINEFQCFRYGQVDNTNRYGRVEILCYNKSVSMFRYGRVDNSSRYGREISEPANLRSPPLRSPARHLSSPESADNSLSEEFIDDEFDSFLMQQPHMQLSVGSSDNLLR